MANRNWVKFLGALLVWAVLFYLMDIWVMNAQGLPVGANLMPVSAAR